CAAAVMTQVRSGGTDSSTRSRACWSRVRSPTRVRNCLGRFCRLRGQKRVPPPPAMIIAWSTELPPCTGRQFIARLPGRLNVNHPPGRHEFLEPLRDLVPRFGNLRLGEFWAYLSWLVRRTDHHPASQGKSHRTFAGTLLREHGKATFVSDTELRFRIRRDGDF